MGPFTQVHRRLKADVRGCVPDGVGDRTFHGIRGRRIVTPAAGVHRAGGHLTAAIADLVPEAQVFQDGDNDLARAALGLAGFLAGFHIGGDVLVTPSETAQAEDLIQRLAHVVRVNIGQVGAARHSGVSIGGQLLVEFGDGIRHRQAGHGFDIFDVHCGVPP